MIKIDENNQVDLAKMILKQRTKLNMSREKLARLSECSMGTIVNIEAGKTGTYFDILLRICSALDIEVFIQFKVGK